MIGFRENGKAGGNGGRRGGGRDILVFRTSFLLLVVTLSFFGPSGTVHGFSTPPSSVGTAAVSETTLALRPLQQNWWPVILESALDKNRPNPIELLDQKLVIWKQGNDDDDDNDDGGSWSCLQDQCAHRFAPLSEGRMITSIANDGPTSDDEGNCGSGCSPTRRLQCAYHGWEFDKDGSCARIPQQMVDDNNSKKSSNNNIGVQSYPLRVEAGMVWVWSDPSTKELATTVQVPISNLLQRFHKSGGTARGFMRDLPYGMELLGENLVDISHLPFSHHSVGSLNRDDGRPVPLKILSTKEKEMVAAKQKSTNVLPLFQSQVIDAADHDPELVAAWKSNPQVQNQGDKSQAVATVAFYDPCHIRYYRNPGLVGGSYEINLFMSPITTGKARVFLFTPFEQMLPPEEPVATKSDEEVEQGGDNEVEEKKDDSSTRSATASNSSVMRSASGDKTKQQPFVTIRNFVSNRLHLKKKSPPPKFPPHLGHMIAHQIFDGDGIFLNKQGDRMRRSHLNFRQYQTPTSSDLMVNRYRRWLEKVADLTLTEEEVDAQIVNSTNSATNGDVSLSRKRAVMAATGSCGDRDDDGVAAYVDNRARSDMLDRYTSHTSKCQICLDALQSLKERQQKLGIAKTALIGASGASATLCLSTVFFSVLYSTFMALTRLRQGGAVEKGAIISSKMVVAATTAIFSTAIATIGSWIGSKEIIAKQTKTAQEIQQFYFEDYVHAEKH